MIKVVVDKGGYMPTKAHKDDAGFDLYSPTKTWVEPNSSISIDTRVRVEIPTNCVGFVKSKSGLMVRDGIRSEGVIDCGYTGTIVVKLFNDGNNTITIDCGQKISQLVILPIINEELEVVEELEERERGANGFGSSGK